MHAWAAAVAGLLSSSCPLSQILLIALWALGLIVSFAVLPWSGVGSKHGVYYAVDQDTGGLFFVGDGSRQLRAFDAGTGALLRKLDLGGIITSGPAIVNDMVFVGVGLGPTGEQQGVYGLSLQGRHTAARARRTARGDRS